MTTKIDKIETFGGTDLEDLCDVTDAAIVDGGGFGWLEPPARAVLETYWKGVLLVPGRDLFVARLDGTISGSAQLVRPTRNNEARAFAAELVSAFVAPWARGHGLARGLAEAVEATAALEGFRKLDLDVRETQDAAIKLYESLGYVRWGTNPNYAFADGEMIAGHYYSKDLRATRRGAAKKGGKASAKRAKRAGRSGGGEK
ncbi:MAG: GNAT family N-acetyltransferase [Alphaproteobacteria bacterium]